VTKITFASHSKKFRSLSIQPGLRGSNDLRVGRKMATFQFFFFSWVGLRIYQHPCTVSDFRSMEDDIEETELCLIFAQKSKGMVLYFKDTKPQIGWF